MDTKFSKEDLNENENDFSGIKYDHNIGKALIALELASHL